MPLLQLVVRRLVMMVFWPNSRDAYPQDRLAAVISVRQRRLAAARMLLCLSVLWVWPFAVFADGGVATLLFPPSTGQRYLQLLAVDDVARPATPDSSVTLPSGVRDIIVRAVAGDRSITAEIIFTAKPGAEYRLVHRWEGYGVYVALDDGLGGRTYGQSCQANPICAASPGLAQHEGDLLDRGAYRAPELSEQQAAYVFVPRGTPEHIDIERVDGFRPTLSDGPRGDVAGPLVLAPGKHILDVSLTKGGRNGISKIWFVAEAGATYDIDYRASDAQFVSNGMDAPSFYGIEVPM